MGNSPVPRVDEARPAERDAHTARLLAPSWEVTPTLRPGKFHPLVIEQSALLYLTCLPPHLSHACVSIQWSIHSGVLLHWPSGRPVLGGGLAAHPPG